MRIVLTSVLKPVTDPRLLARLGRTLAELPGAEVHILAHVAADAPTARPDTERPNVFLHPIFDFPRLSLNRALAGRRLLRKLRELRPDVLVIGAAELLPAGLQWQRRTKGKLVYDVRENYALNVRTQGVFPPLIAGALAARIERMEAAAAPHLAGALLAERVYAEQLPWLKDCKRVEIIENKYQPTSPIPNPPLREPLTADRPLRLLITGTLSELYGTFDAIDAVREAHATGRLMAVLTVAGFAPQAADAARLRTLAARYSWLQLTGIERAVPHAGLIDAVRSADLGLLPYRAHPSLVGCIPTKLWEYLGEALPALLMLPLDSALLFDRSVFVMFSEKSQSLSAALVDCAAALRREPASGSFSAPPEVFWSTEAARLIAFFRSLS